MRTIDGQNRQTCCKLSILPTFRNLWTSCNKLVDSRILRRSIRVFVSHRHHSISISAFFCVLIASSLLCAPGGNRLDQSRTSLVDFSREPVRLVYTLDLLQFAREIIRFCFVLFVSVSRLFETFDFSSIYHLYTR